MNSEFNSGARREALKTRRTSRRRVLLFALGCLCVVLLAEGIFFYIHQEYRFIIGEVIAGLDGPDVTLSETSFETATVDISEFLADTRVEQNDSMMLINTEHMLSEDYSPEIGEYKDSGVFMNTCITKAYAELSQEVLSIYNEKLYVSSAYRTAAEQLETAAEEGDVAQKVGASEHQAGLGVDVYTMYHAGMAFLDGEPGRWVNRNCQNFGFIIRYPYNGKRDTGITYEPWHLRYVGHPHAEVIMSAGTTLESYISSLEPQKFYSCNGYTVTRQAGPQLSVPKSFSSAVISPDNCGYYIITFSG